LEKGEAQREEGVPGWRKGNLVMEKGKTRNGKEKRQK
jgi:hypothetical protein